MFSSLFGARDQGTGRSCLVVSGSTYQLTNLNETAFLCPDRVWLDIDLELGEMCIWQFSVSFSRRKTMKRLVSFTKVICEYAWG